MRERAPHLIPPQTMVEVDENVVLQISAVCVKQGTVGAQILYCIIWCLDMDTVVDIRVFDPVVLLSVMHRGQEQIGTVNGVISCSRSSTAGASRGAGSCYPDDTGQLSGGDVGSCEEAISSSASRVAEAGIKVV